MSVRNQWSDRIWYVGWTLLLCCFLGLFSSNVTWARNNGDDAYYEDTEENHRAFQEALQSWSAPSQEIGKSEEILKEIYSKNADLLRRYRFAEVAEKVKYAMLDEVVHLDTLIKTEEFTPSDIRFWFFLETYKVLERVGNRQDRSEVENIESTITELIKHLRTKGVSFEPSVIAEMDAFYKKSDSIKQLLGSTAQDRASAFDVKNELQLHMGRDFLKGRLSTLLLADAKLFNYESAKARGMAWIDEVRSRIERKAFGQPEVVEALLDLEFARLGDEPRKKPRVLWMMGIESTGKDSHIQAYLDAIHGYEGAYRDNMFEMTVAKTTADAWKHFGSNAGYVGSDKQSNLIRFLVEHSNGRYKIEKIESQGDKSVERVVKTGKVTNENSADAAVISIGEIHNWSMDALDLILKGPLETGVFHINNPNGGESKIEVPVDFILSSNDGINLIKPKGHTEGRKLTYDEMIKLWQANHKNTERIRHDISKKNKIISGEVRDHSAGISEEVLRRIPDDGLLLLRPLSPTDMQKIAAFQLSDLAQELSQFSSILGRTKVTFADDTAARVQEFLYNPEQGGRNIKAKIRQLISHDFYRAMKSGKIPRSEESRNLVISLVTNPDDSWSLKIDSLSSDGTKVLDEPILFPISATDVLKKTPPMSDEAILRLKDFEKALSERIVGAQSLSKQLKEALLAAENARHAGKNEKARRFLFLGLSSTGKTQTAKEVAKFIYGDEGDLVTIDFNGMVSEHQVRELIYGTPGGQPSPFMRAFDRMNGKVVFLFDEIANVANPNILTPLYQLLDEKRIDQFNDGRLRDMQGVTIIMTGNAGEEIFHGIPNDVPDRVRRAAMSRIYKKFMSSDNARRNLLETKFREAFLNRVGDKNTMFFAPLDFQSARELIQLKMSAALQSLRHGNGRNYDVVFKDEAAYEKMLDVMEIEGFNVREQGRSIDRYVSEYFTSKIISLLQEELIPSETRVVIEPNKRVKEGERDNVKEFETFNVWVHGRAQPLELRLDTKKIEKEPLTRYQDQIQTAFHEAGHEIARHALMQDLSTPERISIIPGVDEIAGKYIYYAGVAVQETTVNGSYTKEYILSRLAVLIAGGEAQRLINKGQRSGAGQSNDIERANTLAKILILKFGLDKVWGLSAPASGQTDEMYLASLTEKQRDKLDEISRGYLKQARQLAREVLASNYKAFVEMAVELAIKGEVYAPEIKAIYEKNPVPLYWDMSWLQRKAKHLNFPYLKTWALSLLPSSSRNLDMVSSVPQIEESQVANIDEIIEKERQESIQAAKSKVKASTLPLAEKGEIQSRCLNLMGKVAEQVAAAG